ncbi:MAG: response regulator, partial [Bacteroidota bacterium]
MNPTPFKIYIAEDNAQYLALLEHQLNNALTEVSGFTTTAGLHAAMVNRPDIVVLDYQFDDEAAGLDLLRTLKTEAPEVHVIMVSGQQDPSVAVEALKAGATDYLEKNMETMHQVKEAVARIIHFNQQKLRTPKGGWMQRLLGGSWKGAAMAIMLLLCLVTGCAPSAYVYHGMDAQMHVPQELKIHEAHRIQPDDKVSLSIWNNDDMSVGSVFGIYNSNEVYGKWVLVDARGFATLPLIGNVHLAGKSTTEAAELLQEMYGKEIREPVIVVRVLNREVTVTGEVKEPGNFILDKEKYTLAEVLGKAEGFTDYAKL